MGVRNVSDFLLGKQILIQTNQRLIYMDFFHKLIFDQSSITACEYFLTLNNKFIRPDMKSSKTQKKSLQTYVNLPPIHKRSLISEEISFEQSIDSVNQYYRPNQQKISIQLAKMYTKIRNKSDSKDNEKSKIKSKIGNLVDNQQSKRKYKKNKNQHLRQQTELLLGKKNPESTIFQESFQHYNEKYRKLQTQANINDDHLKFGNGIDDNTLVEFKRKIAQNKAYIKKQILKRSEEKEVSTNPSNKKLTQPVKQKKQIHQNKARKQKQIRYNQYPTECTTPKGGNDQSLFSQLQQILTNKFQIEKKHRNPKTIETSESQLVIREQHQNRVQKLVTKIRKLSPQQSRQNIRQQAKQYSSKLPSKLKDINNYSQWRKADLSKADPVKYIESSFQVQQSRLSQIADRNDSSIANYLEGKKQLLRLGLRAYTEQER